MPEKVPDGRKCGVDHGRSGKIAITSNGWRTTGFHKNAQSPAQASAAPARAPPRARRCRSTAPWRRSDAGIGGLLLDMPRIEAGGHRLDALALAGQQQAGAIAAQRIDPVGVTDLLGKSAYVSLEPDLTSGIGRNRKRLDHAILYGCQIGSYNRLCDTVRLPRRADPRLPGVARCLRHQAGRITRSIPVHRQAHPALGSHSTS